MVRGKFLLLFLFLKQGGKEGKKQAEREVTGEHSMEVEGMRLRRRNGERRKV